MAEPYRTVAGRGESTFEIRRSEFIGRAAPARTVEAAEAFVAEVREAHPDASHNVPAYRVRVGDDAGGYLLREYSSDDGEPTNSAGKPALNVLVQQEVENVVVAITRYYGGTNLGVGGLARAYSRGAQEAIEDAGIVEREPHERLSIAVDYDDSGTVRGILESAGVEFEAAYGERVAFEAWVPSADVGALRERVGDATSGRAEIDD